MAGMGPAPKPAGQRVRRNVVPGTVFLPAEGYQGPIPDWPLMEGAELELMRWERLWRTPQAAQWARMHIGETVARYVRTAIAAEDFDRQTSVAIANIKGEARQLEDRLGLNPLALLRLRWEIIEDEVAEKRDTAVVKRHIRAVDSGTG